MDVPHAATSADGLIELARAQIGGAGDWSLATDRAWLNRMYVARGTRATTWVQQNGELAAAAAVCPPELAGGSIVVTTLIRPGSEDVWPEQWAWIEAAIRDASAAIRPTPSVQVVSEALSDAEVARWRSAGYELVFEEIAMEREITSDPGAPRWPPGTRLLEWDADAETASFLVYEAAFRDRPGFPGWTQAEWVDRMASGDDFLAGASLCALLDGSPACFVVCHRGWISQVGVIPSRRRIGLASALLTEAAARMRALGLRSVRLHVNANNPGALAAWDSLGWQSVGRRGRFERMASP